jgi:hypothetical protein
MLIEAVKSKVTAPELRPNVPLIAPENGPADTVEEKVNDSTPGAIESWNVLVPRLNPPIVAAVVTDSVLVTPEAFFENEPLNFSANPAMERLAAAFTLTAEPTFDTLTWRFRLKPASADAVPLALKSPEEVKEPCTVTCELRLSMANEPLKLAPKLFPV